MSLSNPPKNAFDPNTNHLCKSISPYKWPWFDFDKDLTMTLTLMCDLDFINDL